MSMNLHAQLCLTLCSCMDCIPPGSSVHRIPQPRIMEWVAMPSSRGSLWPRGWTRVSCIADRFLTTWVIGEATHIVISHGSMFGVQNLGLNPVCCVTLGMQFNPTALKFTTKLWQLDYLFQGTFLDKWARFPEIVKLDPFTGLWALWSSPSYWTKPGSWTYSNLFVCVCCCCFFN